MKGMILVGSLLLGLAGRAAAAPRVEKQVDSSCRFQSSDGAVVASFSVKHLVYDEDRGREEIVVTSTLALDGKVLPMRGESCLWRRAGGTYCVHDGNYELRPRLVSEGPLQDTAASAALVRWSGVDLLGLGEGSCQ